MTIHQIRVTTSLILIGLVWGGVGASLISCTAAQNARVVADGQAFCGIATATGPLVVALADASGAPVIVTGMASSAVAANCAIIGAIPVAPPPAPALAPVVAAAVPKPSV